MFAARRAGLSVLLAVTAAWALLAVVACFAVPLVTVYRGTTGAQPQVPLVGFYGPGGALPGALLLVAALVTALVLRWGRASRLARWRVAAAWVWSVVVFVLCLGASLLAPRGGLFLVPFGVLLIASAAVAEGHRSSRRT